MSTRMTFPIVMLNDEPGTLHFVPESSLKCVVCGASPNHDNISYTTQGELIANPDHVTPGVPFGMIDPVLGCIVPMIACVAPGAPTPPPAEGLTVAQAQVLIHAWQTIHDGDPVNAIDFARLMDGSMVTQQLSPTQVRSVVGAVEALVGAHLRPLPDGSYDCQGWSLRSVFADMRHHAQKYTSPREALDVLHAALSIREGTV